MGSNWMKMVHIGQNWIKLDKTRSNMIKLKQNGTKLNIITNIKIVQDVQIV